MRELPIILVFLLLSSVSCNRTSEYYQEQGDRYFQTGKYDDARIAYVKATQRASQSGEAYFRLGLTELKRGHAVDAYEALTRASDLLPRREDIAAEAANVILPTYMADPTRPKKLYEDLVKFSDRLLEANQTSYDGL